jgi:hypothetical protein
VLLHLAGSDPQALSPAGLQVLALSPRWTIVTGADDAAIVNAYQTLKQLLRQPRQNSGGGGRGGPQRIGLVVMGSPGEVAQRVVSNLDATARSFLGLPIHLVGAKQRMEPVNVRFLGSFVMDDAQQAGLAEGLADLLGDRADKSRADTVRAGTARGEAALAATARVQTAPGDTAADAAAAATIERMAEPTASAAPLPMPDPEPQPRRRAEPARPARPTQPAQAAAAASPQAFEPVQAIERPRPAEPVPPRDADRTPSLHGWLAGSIRLEARCPDEPGVELTLDEDGRVHVLAQCLVASQGEAAAAGELARAAVSLLAARQWVRRHFELLTLTQRQCRFDPAARPAMHLFTDHGPLASRLSQRVGQTLHVHLLSPPSHSRQGWHSFALA